MKFKLTILLALLSCSCIALADPKLVIRPNHEQGVYEPGEKVTWSILALDGETKLAGQVTYDVRRGGLTEIAKGTVELKEGQGEVTATREDAGYLLLFAKYKPADAKKEVTALGGAIFAPEKIAPSAPVPDDFDEFWKTKIAELHAVPMNAKLERVDIGDPKVEYYKITLDNIRGSKVYGQIAKPAGKMDLPALLQVQWAGVYPLHRDWVVNHARNGWLSMNIMAHDLPIDEKQEFYQAKSAKELNDYPGQGNDDRETAYFLRMFLSCRRAVDYLTEHEDWNKKSLIVHGGSQGGYQAFVTAGLSPAVTGMAASVPAGCDHTGKAAGRSPGWPNWAGRTWQGKDEKKMLSTARYFDAMNFATRVKCPALVGVGLVDTVCPAEGVLAACNQLQGPKDIVLMPLADHGGDHKAYYAKFGPFLEKQKSGGK